MRASLVALVAAVVVGASLPLAMHATASPGALAAPIVEGTGGDGSRLVQWDGVSAFHLRGLCQPPVCYGASDAEDGRFFLPTNALDGHVHVWWNAANDHLRNLSVTVGGITLTGESPLEFDIPGSQAGEYAVHAEPANTTWGVEDQRIAWTASFHLTAAPVMLERSGSASYATLTGCTLLLCDSTLDTASDPLVVPWSARGALHADWDPKAGPLTVSIAGTGLTATGAPPLTLALDGITAGEWHVDVRPPTVAKPLSSQTIRWSAEMAPAG